MNIKATAAVTAVFAFFALASAANAAKAPEKVRIGIYYGSNSINSVNISSDKGMQIGSVKDSKFTPFVNETAESTLTVRKDADLHIMLGSGCTDYAAAKAQVDAIKQKGVNAYAAYVDTWQVWTGFYADANSAQADIANLQKNLGNGTYTVIPSDNSRIAAVDLSGLTIVFGGASHFNVSPVSDSTLKLDKKGYRGDLEVRRFTGSDMTVINSVALDQYLYGVVPSEIEADSNSEALKAQAVAARTYTIVNLGKYAKYDFDLDTTTACQVYGGITAENPSSNKAVDETKDKFITYNSEPAEVFYFASSGGRTADSKSVWGEEIPYLKSVDDKYEKNHSNWEVTMT
ncbi:MAG TPA: SpoIID/LytB domain-containing protein, partial [Clostridia bacterium]